MEEREEEGVRAPKSLGSRVQEKEVSLRERKVGYTQSLESSWGQT